MNIETMIALEFLNKLGPHEYFLLTAHLPNCSEESELS